jgi:anti-sigma factor RsiW
MRGPTPSPDTCGCAGEVAAYALGALSAAEATAFQAHLTTCVVCSDELSAFEQAVDWLPMSTPQYPAPDRLRRRVMEAVRDEGGVRLAGRPPLRPPRVAPRLRRSVLALASAVAVLVAAALGWDALGPSGTSATHVYQARVTGPGTAQVDVTGHHAELIVRHLPPPPAGQIYEVWLERRGYPPTPTSALFSVTAGGDADADVPGDIHAVEAMMVTPEPASGSLVPTHPAVIRARLGGA